MLRRSGVTRRRRRRTSSRQRGDAVATAAGGSTLGETGRQVWISLRAMLALTVLLGVVYPLVVTGVGRLMSAQADGSLVRNVAGHVVGSNLIGQSFCDASGHPLAQYFQPRPSAAGEGCGYDATRSGGSNLGLTNPALIADVTKRRDDIAAFNGVPASAVPADAVTASASGLDPAISPAYADIQVARVAAARGLPVEVVRGLVAEHTTGRTLGFLGEPRVNVVTLNLALDQWPG